MADPGGAWWRGRRGGIAAAVAALLVIAGASFAAGYALRANGDGDGARSATAETPSPAAGGGSTAAARATAAAPTTAPAQADTPAPAVAATAAPRATPTAMLLPALTPAGPRPPPTAGLPVPWVGVNNWALGAASDVHGDCGGASEALLEQKMTRWRAAGTDVVRFAAYQSFATDAAHQRNWAAFDRVFASAQAHGIRLIPVLGNNWTDCDYWGAYPGAQGKDTGTPLACGGSGNWYDIGYRQPYNGYITGYRQWVADVVGRYAHSPALAAWELVNEPWESCIHDFFVDVIGVLRAADPATPISLGSGGGGEAWSRGDGYRRETALADWATVHDYGHPDDPLPVCPGKNCLRTDLADAGALGKPLYVGEAGIWDDANCDSPARADRYRARMRAAFDAGASGYILWAYNERAPAGECGLDFGPDSPIMKLFAEF